MSNPCGTLRCRGGRIVSLLLLPVLLIAGRPQSAAAHGEGGVPAKVVPHRHTSETNQQAAAPEQTALTLHSLTHPFAPPPSSNLPSLILYTRGYGSGIQPGYPIASGEKAVWYSAGANTIRSSLLLPTVTWLGTEAGLKRVNNVARTVQHFGTLDGLPYNSVTALGGSEQQLYCCAGRFTPDKSPQLRYETVPHRSTLALCRYHAESGRWESIAEATRDYPQGVQVAAPAQSKAQSQPRQFAFSKSEQQFVAVGGGRACLVMGPALPGQGLVLIAPTQKGEAEEVFCPSFARTSFHVSFAHADANGLWIGSDLGLLRYDFQARRWEQMLSDLIITGGCPARQGGFWLLTERFAPAHQDKDGNALQTAHWQITRFTPGQLPEHFALADHENHDSRNGGDLAFTNIAEVGDRVWTTEQRLVESLHAQWTYLPTVYSLRPATRQITSESQVTRVTLEASSKDVTEKYGAVPEVVLAHALTGDGGLVPFLMPTRFPGWTCSRDEKDMAWRTLPSPGGPLGVDAYRERWYAQSESGSGPQGEFSRDVLKHTGTAPVVDESYTFPPFTTPTYDPVSAPALVGANVYLIVHTYPPRLCRWDRKTATMVPIPEMDATLARIHQGVTPYRLLSDGTALWIGTGRSVLRYEVQTHRIDTWEGDRVQGGSWAAPYPLLAVSGGKAWVKGTPNRLFTADRSAAGELTPVALPAFPAEVEQDPQEANLFALEDGIAWFRAKTAAVPRRPILIGYRLQSHSWTASYPATLFLPSPADTIPLVKQGPTHWFYSLAGPLGFNTETGKWEALPAIPQAMQAYTPQLAAVDAQSVWAFHDNHLLRLDRIQNTWSRTEMPFRREPFFAPPALRDAGSLLVPTRSGLWTLNLTAGKVAQAPPTSNSGKITNYSVVAVDANAVWVIAGRAGEGFLVRFDRTTHAFAAFPGYPEGLFPAGLSPQWIGDGDTCWLNTSGATYRLNIKSRRWENISARIAAGRNPPTFQQIVPDGADVWLVAALTDAHFAPLLHPPAVPLYRYRIKTGEITPVQPASGAPVRPHQLTVNRARVLLATAEGDFRLDRSTQRWQPLPTPVLPGGVPFQERQAVYEEAGTYWFVGTDSSLRITP